MEALSFSKQRMTLVSVNARSEVHGDSREPAGDIGLEANLPNDILTVFHPALKAALYCRDESKPKDLAEQGQEPTEGHLPNLRFPGLAQPLKWNGELTDFRVGIALPGAADDEVLTVLTPVKVNKFEFTLLEGGTVEMRMRIQAHPDQQAFGALSVHVQHEVEVTLTREEPAQAAITDGEAQPQPQPQAQEALAA